MPRTDERALARYGLLTEAEPVFTQGARLPLAGLWLVLPALAVTGLLEVFTDTYGRLRNGFYGLRPVVLTLLFLALLRDPRAEGLTRVTPADLGRLLGLDRAPEVKTLRRKLGELAGYRRGAALQSALAAAHAAARPDAIGYLMIDGHMRAYFGTRDLQKTHVARLHMAARATAETWVADADGQPAMVITAAPSKSLAGEIERLLPQLRATVGAHRSATLIFDRGGWSPTLLKKIVDAEFDLICWRKGDFEPLGRHRLHRAQLHRLRHRRRTRLHPRRNHHRAGLRQARRPVAAADPQTRPRRLPTSAGHLPPRPARRRNRLAARRPLAPRELLPVRANAFRARRARRLHRQT